MYHEQAKTLLEVSQQHGISHDTGSKPAHYSNQQAVALAYASGDIAPRVLAKGRGVVAEQIIALAKQHQVFVHESKDLLALLMQVDLDSHIPPALYQAIAELLVWLYRLEQGQAVSR